MKVDEIDVNPYLREFVFLKHVCINYVASRARQFLIMSVRYRSYKYHARRFMRVHALLCNLLHLRNAPNARKNQSLIFTGESRGPRCVIILIININAI